MKNQCSNYYFFDAIKDYFRSAIKCDEKPVYRQLICNYGKVAYLFCYFILFFMSIILINLFHTKNVIFIVLLVIFGLVILFLAIRLNLIYDVFLEKDKKMIKSNLSKTNENRENILQIKKEVEMYTSSLKLSYESSISVNFANVILGFIIGKISDIKPQNMEEYMILIAVGFWVIYSSFFALEIIKESKRYKFNLYQILILELENLAESSSNK